MLIRQATITDADLLATLGVTTADEALEPPYNPAETVAAYIGSLFTASILQVELTDSQSRFFIVVADELTQEAVGYAKLRCSVPPRRLRPAIEIQRIYRLQKATRQGLGEQLIRHCLDYARSSGYRVVRPGVWEHNRRALAFYNKIGFERFNWHYSQFGADRQRDFWLQKQL